MDGCMLYFFNRHKKLLRDKALFLQETMDWFLKGRADLLSGVSAFEESKHLKQKEVDIDRISQDIKREKKHIEDRVKFFVKEFDFVTKIKDIFSSLQESIHDKQEFRDLLMEYGVDLYAFTRSVSKYEKYVEESSHLLDNCSDYFKSVLTVDISDYIKDPQPTNHVLDKNFDTKLLSKAVQFFSTVMSLNKNTDQKSMTNAIYFIEELLLWLESSKDYWTQVLAYSNTIETLIDISRENIKASKLPVTEENVDEIVSKVVDGISLKSEDALRSQVNLSYSKVGILTE